LTENVVAAPAAPGDSDGRSLTTEAVADPSDEEISRLFGEITNNVDLPSRRAAVKAVAARLGLSTKHVYDALERAKT
jgi:hypothetical protein